MHELSIAAYLLDSVQEQALARGARRVLAINLVAGDRSGIVDHALQFSFDLLAPDTPAEGALIHIRRTPMRFHCATCQREYTPAATTFQCTRCGAFGHVVDDATALMIESLEIET